LRVQKYANEAETVSVFCLSFIPGCATGFSNDKLMVSSQQL